MAVMTQPQSARPKAIIQLTEPLEEQPVLSHLAGRLIQITLAIYLIPALLAVLVVGGAGILILKCSQLFTAPFVRSGASSK